MTVSPALPLDGIKVLELSRILAGPWCAMSLADLGAEVWKVEHPTHGDDTRTWSPPSVDGISTYYLCANRGKQSLTVDLKTPQGQQIVRDLAAKADVVVENFRRGSTDSLGLDYATLSANNPGLIYCSISGYGRTGPAADRPGYDFVIQAESGLMSITGDVDGAPTRVPVAITDVASGMIATQGILAALIERHKTGKGQLLDIALFDTAISLLVNVASGHLNTGGEAKRYGNAHPTVVPYQIFETSDGIFALAVGNDAQFRRLCVEVIDQPDMADDVVFRSNESRANNRVALVKRLQGIFRDASTLVWLEKLALAEVPAGRVQSVSEALSGPTADARRLVTHVPHPTLGEVAYVRPVQGLQAQLTRQPVAPPLLGQHTDELLKRELKLNDDNLSALRKLGAIGKPLINLEEGRH